MRDLMLLSSCWRCHRCQSIGRRLLFLASSASSSVVFDPAFVIQQRRFLRYPSPPERKRNYYEVLGVKRSATPKEIRDAYISQSKKLHPDRVASSQSSSDKGSSGREKFQELQEAYDVLRKPSTRTEYDQKLSEGSSGPRPPNPNNPNQAWNDYQRWMQQQQQYAQYQQQKQSWRMSDDPWENFRRAREQRYAEYQKFYAKQEPFRPRGGTNDSPGLALFRFFLIITIATIIAHILQYNIYQQAFEKRRKNLVERDEIARSYLRQAHIKRGIENGIVYPSEEDLGHILKQDIDDQALLRAETQRPREIREEERWMTAVMRDQRR